MGRDIYSCFSVVSEEEEETSMKIAVIGSGAMGCLYGSYLSQHNEVTMLDVYEPQVQALNENGITVMRGTSPRR